MENISNPEPTSQPWAPWPSSLEKGTSWLLASLSTCVPFRGLQLDMFPCPPCPKLSVCPYKFSSVPLFRFLHPCFFFSAQDSPLKTLMSRYEEAMGLSGHKLSFFFDGTKLSGKELPADLGMESGDLIEVWG